MRKKVFLAAVITAIGSVSAFAQNLSQEWLIASADVVRGTLAPGDAVLDEDDTFYDAYVLPVEAGAKYTISLISDDFDPYLIVRNHLTGKTVQDDDGGTGSNSLLNLTAEGDGFVVVFVNSYKVGSGAYTLTIE